MKPIIDELEQWFVALNIPTSRTIGQCLPGKRVGWLYAAEQWCIATTERSRNRWNDNRAVRFGFLCIRATRNKDGDIDLIDLAGCPHSPSELINRAVMAGTDEGAATVAAAPYPAGNDSPKSTADTLFGAAPGAQYILF